MVPLTPSLPLPITALYIAHPFVHTEGENRDALLYVAMFVSLITWS